MRKIKVARILGTLLLAVAVMGCGAAVQCEDETCSNGEREVMERDPIPDEGSGSRRAEAYFKGVDGLKVTESFKGVDGLKVTESFKGVDGLKVNGTQGPPR